MKNVLTAAAFIGLVVFASALSAQWWGGKPEGKFAAHAVTIQKDMTVAQFGQSNDLPNPMLKKMFDLQSRQDLQKPLSAFGLSSGEIQQRLGKLKALRSEHASKNWQKILVKFGLWFAWLGVIFILLRKNRITAANRLWLLSVPIVVFGVILGADPNPMGTVKDAIVLYANDGVIFPPRLIAFGVFMLLVIVANKLICSWGCQFGTLQDVLFQIFHKKTDSTARTTLKLPFVVTNSMRIVFLLTFIGVVAATGIDFIEQIDPFKIFKPQMLGWIGGVFVGVLLLASVFIYRPWCHLFCPFGLVGWLGEKISVFRIRINRDTCIDCKACVKACPSRVMESYLEKKSPAPDCFSCGKCMETCPTKAIEFSAKNPTSKT